MVRSISFGKCSWWVYLSRELEDEQTDARGDSRRLCQRVDLRSSVSVHFNEGKRKRLYEIAAKR